MVKNDLLGMQKDFRDNSRKVGMANCWTFTLSTWLVFEIICGYLNRDSFPFQSLSVGSVGR